MSTVVAIKCDSCGAVSKSSAGSIRAARLKLVGWSSGYVNQPYAGKRADFCPKCTKQRAEEAQETLQMTTKTKVVWFAKGGGIAKCGPHESQVAATNAMRLAGDGPKMFPDDVFVWPEEVSEDELLQIKRNQS